MNPQRLAEIIQPLESLLGQHEFQMEGEPMVEGSVRMASFVRRDGVKVDYTLEVRKDEDKGRFKSDSDVHLNAMLYKGGKTVPLFQYLDMGSNMPATEMVKDIVDEHIKPTLVEHLWFNSIYSTTG